MNQDADKFSLLDDSAIKLPLHRFAHEAMNTIFGVSVLGGKIEYAQSAARAAFEEVDRLERLLSRFIEGSDVWRINHLEAGHWAPVSTDTLRCLQLAEGICDETNGAFDISIGRLLTYWRKSNRPVDRDGVRAFNEAAVRTGMELLQISERACGVGVKARGVQIDLGGIGKGYAVDRMMELLREWDMETILTHGGQSTVRATGSICDHKGWPLTLRNPEKPSEVWVRFDLRDQSLSASGRLIQGEHIVDPRTCEPARGKVRVWVLAKSAALSDAVSTAFMVMSPDEIEQYCQNHKDVGTILASTTSEGCQMRHMGADFTK